MSIMLTMMDGEPYPRPLTGPECAFRGARSGHDDKKTGSVTTFVAHDMLLPTGALGPFAQLLPLHLYSVQMVVSCLLNKLLKSCNLPWVCFRNIPNLPLKWRITGPLRQMLECLRLEQRMCVFGGMFARRATFLSTIPTSAPNLPSHGETLQNTLHNKAISVNSAPPTVICIVLNKQHWSHKCGCQYI